MAEPPKWTLMFYLASDTPLAPEVVSQLKSIKQAGFHPDVNVVVRFDPNTENAETHIFDINRINKVQEPNGDSKIGFIGRKANDPFVVNLMTDKLWDKQTDSNGKLIRNQLIAYLKSKGFTFNPPKPPPGKSKDKNNDPEELSPVDALKSFLDFCRTEYPADHYVLFILGHGLVVGNDTFLFDENAPEHFLKLKPLGELLKKFRKEIKKRNGKETKAEFELVSFHSCSMSSLEVAFEIQDTANYMLASQSPSFVGSWPYRQILIRMFNHMEREEEQKGGRKAIKGLFTDIFHYCAYQGYDYLVAGYSNDVCLCDLNRVGDIQIPLSELSNSLILGLSSATQQTWELIRERILLAHLDSQSYFDENYTDLFDFCFRLQQRFKSVTQGALPSEVEAITTACQGVMKVLEKGVEKDDDRLIVRTEFVGPAYQYSHGLSVYFPWSQPFNGKFWPKEYKGYEFFNAFNRAKQKSWSDFLEAYFLRTRRHTRADEFSQPRLPGLQDAPGSGKENHSLTFQEQLLEAFATGVFTTDGQLEKPSPNSSQGESCSCKSVKNYPPFTRQPAGGVAGIISVGPTSLENSAFKQDGQGSFALDGIE